MKDVPAIIYWISLAVLVLATVFIIVAAVRQSVPRKFAAWRGIVQIVMAVIVFGGLVLIVSPSFNAIWAVALGVIGAVAGFFAGRGAKFTTDTGKLKIRRSPVAPWLWAVGVILASMTLAFGTSYLFALAMLVLAFALGAVLGQVIAEQMQAKPAVAAGQGGFAPPFDPAQAGMAPPPPPPGVVV